MGTKMTHGIRKSFAAFAMTGLLAFSIIAIQSAGGTSPKVAVSAASSADASTATPADSAWG